jgi:hypothetical protein
MAGGIHIYEKLPMRYVKTGKQWNQYLNGWRKNLNLKEDLILIGYIIAAALGMICFAVLVVVILIAIYVGLDYVLPQELGFWPIKFD